MLGAELVRHFPGAFGVTGPRMRAAGCTSIADIEALSLVGITEVVAHLPRLVRLLRSVERAIVARRPQVVVTIDSPSFTLRLAPRLRAQGIPVVHWVAPQVWAWRRHRAARVARSVDRLACLFPFEPGWFGPVARFTGHPAGTAPLSTRPEALGIAAGSRPSERARHAEVFRAVAAQLGLPVVEAVPVGTSPVVPGARTTADVPSMASQVRVALVSAGTATLELAVAGVPMVVAYKTSASTYRIARQLVKLPSLALPNLLLGAAVVPEHVQQLSVDALARDLTSLFGPTGDSTAARLLETRALLCADHAIERVAELVRSLR